MPVNLNCVLCGKLFSVIPSLVSKGAKYCNYRCHQIGEGRKGGKVTGMLMKKNSKGLAYQKIFGTHLHRFNIECKIGRKLYQGEVVHHIDGNKLNNNINNLILLKNQSQHIKLHIKDMLARKKVKYGY